MNQEGYRNLCKLVSLGYMEGFYYKPRIDKDLLRELNGGLIALSACASDRRRFPTAIWRRQARRRGNYASIFGDRYYIEIQDNKLRRAGKGKPAPGRTGQRPVDSRCRHQRLPLRRARRFPRP